MQTKKHANRFACVSKTERERKQFVHDWIILQMGKRKEGRCSNATVNERLDEQTFSLNLHFTATPSAQHQMCCYQIVCNEISLLYIMLYTRRYTKLIFEKCVQKNAIPTNFEWYYKQKFILLEKFYEIDDTKYYKVYHFVFDTLILFKIFMNFK